jgi:hypothetical protein
MIKEEMSYKIKRLIASKVKYRPPLYGKKTLRVAFELGLVLSEVAKERKIELTAEMSTRAENMLIQELKINGLQKTCINFTPLVLAVLELKEK